MSEPSFHEKQEFIDFCKTKGSKKFDPGNPCACAMTQFFKSIHPETFSTCSASIIGGPFALNYSGKTLGYLELEDYEVERVLDCRSFSKVVKVLSND
jgi:hypothetical protein